MRQGIRRWTLTTGDNLLRGRYSTGGQYVQSQESHG